ncbi:N-acetylglucosamine kinase [Dactylosporangium sp. CA-139066]|uniref:N-acetylglucosamine kinase n=1 Tax=Dactylosporangium sp. CA-139066 TaxID=3239930 RepID=UPI003D90DAD2
MTPPPPADGTTSTTETPPPPTPVSADPTPPASTAQHTATPDNAAPTTTTATQATTTSGAASPATTTRHTTTPDGTTPTTTTADAAAPTTTTATQSATTRGSASTTSTAPHTTTADSARPTADTAQHTATADAARPTATTATHSTTTSSGASTAGTAQHTATADAARPTATTTTHSATTSGGASTADMAQHTATADSARPTATTTTVTQSATTRGGASTAGTARLFAAADGGNSKTDVVLGDSDGRILARVTGPTTSPHVLGLPAAVAQLAELVAQARAAAALPASVELDRLSVYVAGADLPFEVEQLNAAVGGLGLAGVTVVDNDLFALLRAGTSAPDAVGVVCGAGINAAGRRADGATSRFPALGPLSGDWGGGRHLASMALYHACRAEDGRGPATALADAVCRHFGRPTVEAVAIALHLGELPPARLDELSKVLFTVAATGDEVASRVVRRLADEIEALVRVAATRLDLLDRPYTVVLGGGVLTARHPQLHDDVVARIAAMSPEASVTVLSSPPVAGAALLALDALHDGVCPAAVEAVVRKTLPL